MGTPPPSDNVFATNLPANLTKDDVLQLFGLYGTIVEARVVSKPEMTWTAALIRFSAIEEAMWVVENLNGTVIQGVEGPITCRYANNPRGTGDSTGGGKAGAGDKGPRPGPYNEPNGVSVKPGGKGHDGRIHNSTGSACGKGGDSRGNFVGSPAVDDGKGNGKSAGTGKGKGKYTMDSVVVALEASGALPGGSHYVNNAGTIFIHGIPPDTTNEHLYKVFAPFGAIFPKGVRACLDKDGKCIGYGFVSFLHEEAAHAAILTLNGTMMPDGSNLKVTVKSERPGGKVGGRGVD
mmetsp:Transcript_44010/g.121781  ORF Transcript_44010/g.121781 Transcript_44010/m.121781 type:complete len:292 (+) Transcript_44010:67-942(+)